MKTNLKILNIILLIILVSCATDSTVQNSSYEIIREFASKLPEVVKYDPYTAKVYFDRKTIDNRFQEVNFKLQYNGCGSITPIYTFLPDEDVFVKEIDVVNGVQNDNWKKSLYYQIINEKQGWAIEQMEYPKAGLAHGDYIVRSIVLFNIDWCGSNGRGGDYRRMFAFYFDLISPSKNDSEKSDEVKLNENSKIKTTNESNKTSIEEKLKKLKELFDANLIDKKDYEEKKKAILDSI